MCDGHGSKAFGSKKNEVRGRERAAASGKATKREPAVNRRER